jgi:hypothetical protein
MHYAKLSCIKNPVAERAYYAPVIDWRTIMIITWLFDFAEFVRYVREGALIARRKRPDELKRHMAS